jgi:hypothetical protein
MKMKILFLLMATTVLAAACSKSNSDDEPPSPEKLLEGYWSGNYSYSAALNKDNIAMLLQPNGKMRVYDLGDKTDTSSLSPLSIVNGSWSLNGQTVTTSYKADGFKFNTTATLSADKLEMTGSWEKNSVPKGNLYLSR